MKNYYEILEVSENASIEVIERVYKVLAKKYHPDMNLNNQKEAEEKFKEISTAYETLSNPEKRKQYDTELAYEKQKNNATAQRKNSEEAVYKETPNDYNNINYKTKSTKSTEEELFRAQQKSMEDIAREQAEREYQMQKAYNDAYYKALEDMGYTIVYKKTFKDYLRIFLTIVVMLIILVILWHIPPIQQKMIEIYENSGPLKQIIDLGLNLFK